MSQEKFKVKFGLAVGDTAATIDGTTGNANLGDVTVGNNGYIYSNGGLALALTGNNVNVLGDLNVQGGDLTTTSTTGNLYNTTATTVNIAGAATTTNIGKSGSGKVITGNDLQVGGNDILTQDGTTALTFSNVTGDVSVAGDLTVNGGDLITTVSPSNLFNTNATTVNIAGAATTVSIGANTGTTTINNDLVADSLTVSGDLAVNGGDITTTATTASLFNTNATTLNIGGAANAVTIGVDGSGGGSSTTTIRSVSTIVQGDLAVNGDNTGSVADITTTKTSASVFNTTATTLNIGGAATTMNIGNASGTVTIPGNLTVNGTTTTLNTQDLLVEDKNITIGNVAVPTDVTASGGGITLLGTTNKTMTWNNSTDGWEFNQNISTSGNALIDGNVTLNGSTSGAISVTAPAVAGTQSYTLPTALPAVNNYVLASTTGGTMSWVANPDTNTTYDISSSTTTGGANFNLNGSDSTTDTIKFANGTNVTVTSTDANTITIAATDTNTTYTIASASTTGGANLTLTGSDSSTDSVAYLGSGATTVTSTDANTITISSTDTNTTYTQNASSATGGANLNLVGSDSTTDTIKFADGTNVTVTRTDADTITISSTDTNTTYDFNASSTTGGANFNLVGSDSTTDTVKLTNGGHITATYTSATEVTLGSDATDANTASTIVSRDASGNFSASGATLGNVTVGVDTDQTVSTTSGNLILQTAAGVDAGTMTLVPGSFTSTGSSISGTTLTIGTLVSGTIAVGQVISGGTTLTNTVITANLTGTGSGSTWTVSKSQTVSSSSINGAGNITLAPITTGNVALTFNNGANLINSRNYVFGSIRDATTQSNGDQWSLLAGSGSAYRGITLDNSVDTTKRPGVILRSYGVSGGAPRAGFVSEYARGTAASPSNVTSADRILELIGSGYVTGGGTSAVTGWVSDSVANFPAIIRVIPAEDWNDGLNKVGSRFQVILQPPSTPFTTGSTVSVINAGSDFIQTNSDQHNFKNKSGGLNLSIDVNGNVAITGDTIVGGDLRINGNDIQASDGNTNITLTSNTLTTFAGDIKVGGNDIQASDGNVAETLVPITGQNPNVDFTGNIVKGSIRTGAGEANGNVYEFIGNSFPSTGISIDNTDKVADRTSLVMRNFGASLASGNPRNTIMGEAARGFPEGVSTGPSNLTSGNSIIDIMGTGYTNTGWLSDLVNAPAGLIRLATTEAWNNGVNNVGTNFQVLAQPTATALTSGGASLIPIINANPQSNNSRSDQFFWSKGKTNNATMMSLADQSGKVTMSIQQLRAATSADFAVSNFTTQRSTDGVNYTPTQNGDTLGSYKFNGNAYTGTSPGVPAGPACQITVKATENWTSTANGAQVEFYTIKTGTTNDFQFMSGSSDNLNFASTVTTFNDVNNNAVLTVNATNATFAQPVGFPVKTAAQWNAITGSVGQQVCVSDSAGGGNPNGMMAFWDTTNSRWSYIHDNSAV